MKIIEIQDLVKSYGPVKALEGLSLSVPEGSLYGLLGPNGAGKSTLLRIICTLLAQDSGKVIVCGFDALLNPNEIRRNLGYVAQEVAIDKILTGRELLQLQGDLYHLKSDYCKERIENLIDRLDMSEWIDRRTGSFSGGMKRRLDIASGLLHRPRLLVLDEPTVGLDIESRSSIWTLLRELISSGTTILLSSHYLEEIDALSDQMAIIDKGKLIAEGSPEHLKQALGVKRVTLKVKEFSNQIEADNLKEIVKQVDGVKEVVINRSQGYSLNLFIQDQDALPSLREQLDKSGFDVFSLSESRPTLDDVYLHATGKTMMDAELELAGKRDFKYEAKKSMR